MGRQKAVAKDLLANIPSTIDAQPEPTQPPKPKQKRLKKAQPKAMVTQVDTEDTLPISKLASSEKTISVPEKRPAEAELSQSARSKRPRSESATTSGPTKSDAPWAPPITLEDKLVKMNDSADDVNVAVALSTALLLPDDLNRNAKMSEYENFALMLQRSVQVRLHTWNLSVFFILRNFSNNFYSVHFFQAIQHAHSFSMQSFETRKALADRTREATSLQKTNKSLQ
ncbi:unnamed protein product [Camellia sinensis]